MRATLSALFTAVIIAATTAAQPCFAGPPINYSIIDIGVVQKTDTASQGFGVSPNAIAVGRSIGNNTSQAFTWTLGGGIVGLPSLAGRNHSVSNSANDNGIVVGTASTTLFGSNRLPVIWQNGNVMQLPLPPGETLGDAHGVNTSGVAVGSVDGGSFQQGVIYSGGNATIITQTTTTGCFFLTAFGINNSGRIVGQGIDPNNAARNVGIVYDIGSANAFEVGALPGANGALAFGVSNNGHVVGSSMLNQGSGMPFIYSDATGMVAIPLASGTSQGSARGVNSAGWVVGIDSSAFAIPFLYTGGAETYRLADFLPPNSDWDLDMNTSSSALGISDNGIIVGTGVRNGDVHAFAMFPAPIFIDFGITMTDAPDPVQVNHDLTYSMTVTNHSTLFADVGFVRDILPPSLDFVSVTPSMGSCTVGTSTIDCTLGTMQPMTSATIVLVARPTNTGTVSNSAEVIYPEDPNHANDVATSVTTVIPADPSPTPTATPSPISFDYGITMTDSPDPVQVNHDLTYSMTITNHSPGNGDNVLVQDILPNGLSFVSVTPSQGQCMVGTSTINCQLGSIPGMGGTATITLVVQPTMIGTVTNTAITIYPDDPNPSNDTATTMTTVIPEGQTPTPTPTITPTPTSSPTLTPTPSPSTTPPAQPLNLSTRLRVQAGDNVGIGGFIITGTAPKRVILRAIGPSLVPFGVPDALADPEMELHGPKGFTTITNDNWRDTQEAEIQATGLAPTNDLESAIVATLDPGAYTGIVRGKNNTEGVALIEVYDLNQAVPTKLGNISTRAFVSTGADIVIAGFILGGGANDDNLILRGIGPSLTQFGVPDALPDPTLELRDNNGALLIANDDWQDDPEQAALISAAGLAPTNQLESGIAATLAPGQYTVLLAGLDGDIGVGLVEVYDLAAS